ncbi:MAG: flagellar hook-length control protein FliK [Silvanigrellales bacterium]|nr:flagellar hook-length control protein FliK [Silvanigrellales bacterium]
MVATLKGQPFDKALFPSAENDARLSTRASRSEGTPGEGSFDSILGGLLEKVERASKRAKESPEQEKTHLPREDSKPASRREKSQDKAMGTMPRREAVERNEDERTPSSRKASRGQRSEEPDTQREGLSESLFANEAATPVVLLGSMNAPSMPPPQGTPSRSQGEKTETSLRDVALQRNPPFAGVLPTVTPSLPALGTPIANTSSAAAPNALANFLASTGAREFTENEKQLGSFLPTENAEASLDTTSLNENTLALIMASQAQSQPPRLAALQTSFSGNLAQMPLSPTEHLPVDIGQHHTGVNMDAPLDGLITFGDAARRVDSENTWALAAPHFDSVEAEFIGFEPTPLALKNPIATEAQKGALPQDGPLSPWPAPMSNRDSTHLLTGPTESEFRISSPLLASAANMALSGATLLSAQEASARSRDITGRIFLPQRDMSALQAELASLRAEVTQLISDEDILTEARFGAANDWSEALVAAGGGNAAEIVSGNSIDQNADGQVNRASELANKLESTQGHAGKTLDFGFGNSRGGHFGEGRREGNGGGRNEHGRSFQDALSSLGRAAGEKGAEAASLGTPLAARLNEAGLVSRGEGNGGMGTAADKTSVRNISQAALARIEDRALELQARGGGLAKVQIRDARLGQVELRVNMNGEGRIQVEIAAEDPEVRKELEKGIDELRANLERNNLAVGDVKVLSESQRSNSQQNGNEQKNPWQQGNYQQSAQDGRGNGGHQQGEKATEWAFGGNGNTTRDSLGKKGSEGENPAPSLRQRIVQRGENGSLKVFA